MSRSYRHVLVLALLLLASGLTTPGRSQVPPGPFSHEVVQRVASELAAAPFAPPPETKLEGVEELDYDKYRQIRFRRERTIWRGQGLNFEMQVLPTGWLFKTPVEISIVDNGNARPLAPDSSYFELGPLVGKLGPEAVIGFSGFRITNPMNRPDLFDEVIVFQGASYFRALSRGQIYGLSARGLALNVAQAGGEEFPLFRRFWVEKPLPGASNIVIHAVLDSPSVAGAYRFQVTPGSPTWINVQSTLYPRKALSNVGVAPQTSMFLFSSVNRARISDFRPAVHDSDGLAITNGWGEHLWRPLTNPRRLQASSFLDHDPRGFGLVQRTRDFSQFQDLEARYERRPSAWVEPAEGWGPGAVELVEIPSEEEIHDNIVAYWKPTHPLAPGKPHVFNYRLSWPDDVRRSWPGAVVHATRAGLINGPLRKTGALQFVIDFKGLLPGPSAELPVARLDASAGSASTPIVQPNPEVGGVRVSFSFDPKSATSSEMRLVLQVNDTPVSETWLYRWTKS